MPGNWGRSVKRVTLTVLLLTLAACSSKPSSTEIESQVEHVVLADGRNKIFTIADFQKVNGASAAENTYTADIKYNLVFKVGLADLQRSVRAEGGGKELGDLGAALAGSAMLFAFGNFKAGDKLPQQEKVEFQKSENGWVISDGYHPSFLQ